VPSRASRQCSQVGCPKLAVSGSRWCEAHQSNNTHLATRRHYDKERADDPYRAIYRSRHWTEVTRPFIFARDPLCKIAVLCEGKAPSVEVDHVVPIRSGGDPWDTNNLQGACHACHSHKTATEDSEFARSERTR
jgi:5-methylcytosine-specific restriction protein A